MLTIEIRENRKHVVWNFVGRLGARWGIGWFSLVRHSCLVTIVVRHVAHNLNTTIGKGSSIFSFSDLPRPFFSSREICSAVVVFNTVCERVWFGLKNNKNGTF